MKNCHRNSLLIALLAATALVAKSTAPSELNLDGDNRVNQFAPLLVSSTQHLDRAND